MVEKHEAPGAICDIEADNGLPPRYFCSSLFLGSMTLIGLAASTQVSYFYVVAELLPMKYRFAANSLMYVFMTPGGAFAPAIGESLVRTTSAGWRGVFYILIAINDVALLCFTLFYWPPTFRKKHGSQRKWAYVRLFDYFRTLLFVSGLTFSWTSPGVALDTHGSPPMWSRPLSSADYRLSHSSSGSGMVQPGSCSFRRVCCEMCNRRRRSSPRGLVQALLWPCRRVAITGVPHLCLREFCP